MKWHSTQQVQRNTGNYYYDSEENIFQNVFHFIGAHQILMLVILESSENLIVPRKISLEVIRDQIILQEFIDEVSNHKREVRGAHI